MFDVNDLATALGGVAVLAEHKVEVRFQTTWDVHHNNTDNELPLVFSGSMDQVKAWAKTNEFEFKQDRNNLFGGYFRDSHGNTYVLT